MIYQHNTGLDFRPFIYANYPPPPESKLRLCHNHELWFLRTSVGILKPMICVWIICCRGGCSCRSVGMMSPRVFPNLRRMNKYGNLLSQKTTLIFISVLLSCGKYFHRNMGTYSYRIGELPRHDALGLGFFFCWGKIPQNTHRNQKGSCLQL